MVTESDARPNRRHRFPHGNKFGSHLPSDWPIDEAEQMAWIERHILGAGSLWEDLEELRAIAHAQRIRGEKRAPILQYLVDRKLGKPTQSTVTATSITVTFRQADRAQHRLGAPDIVDAVPLPLAASEVLLPSPDTSALTTDGNTPPATP